MAIQAVQLVTESARSTAAHEFFRMCKHGL